MEKSSAYNSVVTKNQKNLLQKKFTQKRESVHGFFLFSRSCSLTHLVFAEVVALAEEQAAARLHTGIPVRLDDWKLSLHKASQRSRRDQLQCMHNIDQSGPFYRNLYHF